MKVLIAGGAGYIGGFLSDLLSAEGYDITVYDSLVYETRFLKKVKFIYGDVRDREKLKTILPEFDCAIWLAAVVGDGACAIDPFLSQSINSDAVEWLTRNYKGKVVLMSTCSVYGANNDLIDESAIPNPLSVYAKTKLEAETTLLANKPDSLVFRLGTLYGLSDDHSRVRFDLVVNILAQKATIGQPLTVFGGEQWRPLLHVKDVACAILHGLNNNISGLYNLHNENYKIYEIADKISEIVPNTVVKYQDISFEDARNYKVVSQKYRDTGWMPKFNMEDGIREIYETIRENRIKNVHESVYSNVDYLKTIKSVEWIK